jgi:hypothetical protein
MPSPKKHKILVELTDVSGKDTEKGVCEEIRIALNCKLLGFEGIGYENIQVKSLRRVLIGLGLRRDPRRVLHILTRE